ncbi:MAG: hypothetical protein NC222_06735 [Staphylococcus sp.]|nr:hypothetical protein [Staphylococcus sp.]
MKKNSKRKHPFVLVRFDTDKTVFISLLQSPKVPERYAWKWAVKKSRDWLRKENVSFSEWSKYVLYPVHSFNCCQFDWNKEDIFYDHIHVADSNLDDDKEGIVFYNTCMFKSKYNCKIK